MDVIHPHHLRNDGELKYVRQFEQEEYLLPNSWIVVRIDGKGFHKLSNHYAFIKPNDVRALNLMNAAARHTLQVLPDILLGYGHSDEYSFVFHKSTTLFERRSAKIASTVVSTFTAAYVHLWPKFFTNVSTNGTSTNHASQFQDTTLDLAYLPTFDSRTVLYPSIVNLRDYLSWRQADCHINNLYNTTFWSLVQLGGMSNTEAEDFLKGTVKGDKHEILWSRFNINYNNEPQIFRKGSTVFREYELSKPASDSNAAKDLLGVIDTAADYDKDEEITKTQREKLKKMRKKAQVVISHLDIIEEDFWTARPWLLSGKPGRSTTTAGST